MHGGDTDMIFCHGQDTQEDSTMDAHRRPTAVRYPSQDRGHGGHGSPIYFTNDYDVIFLSHQSQAVANQQGSDPVSPKPAMYETTGGPDALDDFLHKQLNRNSPTAMSENGDLCDSSDVPNVFDMLDNIDVEDEDQILMDALENNDIVISDALDTDPDANLADCILENERSSPSMVTEKSGATGRTCSRESLPQLRLASEQLIGNNRFYIQLLLHRQKFLEAYYEGNALLCDKIARHVINLVYMSFPRGRFLEYTPSQSINSPTNGSWVDIGYGQATTQRVKACLFHLPSVKISKYFCPRVVAVASSSKPHMDDDGKLKPDNRSNTVTMQTIFSKTISMASNRDDFGCEAKSFRTNSFVARSRDDHIVKNDHENGTGSLSSRFKGSLPASNDNKKKKKGLRRRGLLSSDVPSKNSRFQISSDLEKLVRNVFDRPMDDNNGEDSDDDASECSNGSEDMRPTQRRRSMASQSMCSSVSSLAGLGGEFSNTLKIDSWQKGAKTLRRRKNASVRNSKAKCESITEPELYSDFKVKVMDDSNGSLLYRSLSSYDILCNLDDRPKIMLCNHVGNNRLRVLLKMYQARFNAIGTPLPDKNRLVHDIIQNTLHSEKGQSSFVFQDPDNVNFWVQIPFAHVPKLIVCCLEDCRLFVELPMLPLITERPWVKSLMSKQGVKHQTMEDLHETALKNIRKRKQKKTISGRDKGSIAKLQHSVLMNTVVIEENAKTQ